MAERKNEAPRGASSLDTKKTLAQLLKYLAPKKVVIIVALTLSLVNIGAALGNSYLMKPLINNYIMPGDFSGLAKGLVIMAGVYVLGALASALQNQIMIRVAQGTIRDIRNDLFVKFQALPISYFDSRTHGQIMSLYTNDIDQLQNALEQSFIQILNNSLQFVGTIALMLFLSPTLFIVTAVMMVVILLVTTQIAKRSQKYFRKQQEDISNVNSIVEEMVEGQKVVKVFNREEIAKEEFRQTSAGYRKSATLAQSFGGLIMPVLNNLNNINFALTATFGGVLAVYTGFDIGSLSAYLRNTQSFAQPIQQISMQMNSILAALAGAERIFEAMGQQEEIDLGNVTLLPVNTAADGAMEVINMDWEDRKGVNQWAWSVPQQNGKYSLVPLKGDVRFENVNFSYDEGHPVLQDVSLYAKPGQSIAFVGSTGAGKTTITNLINRFYEINDGLITYDGIDIKDIKKDDLRHSLGMVLQDTHLFTGTISDNIRYGRLSATQDEVVSAAKTANAHHFIKHLPDGYDTVITGDGENLSQGQRQLLAIARTMIANPPVLILDEATSSIDTRTEKLVSDGMDALMEGHTVFVIAHRLSTIRDANAIMVLEGGMIIERGDHDDLMENKGRYYELNTGIAELT